MRFTDLIGNKEAITTLRSMVDSNRIPHAILLSGPSGIGKTLAARAFINYLNCENRINGDSCGVCPSCRRNMAGNNPDIHYIYPVYKTSSPKRSVSSDYLDQWRRFLKESPYMDPAKWLEILEAGNSQPAIFVDEASAISEQASVSSYADRYKVFLIWLPERMRQDAANKLLKIIEEPFEDTLFICISNDPAQILPTVASRLRNIPMRKPDKATITAALMAQGVSKASAETAAKLSEGSLLKAYSILGSENESKEFSNLFKECMRNAYGRKIRDLRSLSDMLAASGREKSIRILEYFARLTRENFIANMTIPPLNCMTADEEDFSKRFAPFIHSGNVEDIMRQIDFARRDISRNANSKLVWFDFLLQLMLLLRRKKSA